MGCSNSLELEGSQNDEMEVNRETSKKINENGDESESSKDEIYKKNKFTSNDLDPIIKTNKYSQAKSPNTNTENLIKVPSIKK